MCNARRHSGCVSVTWRGPWTHQSTFDAPINAAAAKWRVPPALIKGVIARESEFKQVPGPMGERGLMQLTDATARGLGHTGHMDLLWDAVLNIDLGTKLLAENYRQAAGAWGAAISAYNAGWSRQRPRDGKRIGDRNTPFVNQGYVDDIMDNWRYFNQPSTRPRDITKPSNGKPSTGKPGTTKPGAAAGGIGITVALAAGLAALLLLGRR